MNFDGKGVGWSQPVPSLPARIVPCWRVIHPSIRPHTCVYASSILFHRQDGAAATGPSRGHPRTGLLLDPVSLSGDRDAWTGNGYPLVIFRVLQGSMGSMGAQAFQSQVPNPPAGVTLVDIARAVGGGKLLISCPDPRPRKKKTSCSPNHTLRPFIPETSSVTFLSFFPAQPFSYASQPGRVSVSV